MPTLTITESDLIRVGTESRVRQRFARAFPTGLDVPADVDERKKQAARLFDAGIDGADVQRLLRDGAFCRYMSAAEAQWKLAETAADRRTAFIDFFRICTELALTAYYEQETAAL